MSSTQKSQCLSLLRGQRTPGEDPTLPTSLRGSITRLGIHQHPRVGVQDSPGEWGQANGRQSPLRYCLTQKMDRRAPSVQSSPRSLSTPPTPRCLLPPRAPPPRPRPVEEPPARRRPALLTVTEQPQCVRVRMAIELLCVPNVNRLVNGLRTRALKTRFGPQVTRFGYEGCVCRSAILPSKLTTEVQAADTEPPDAAFSQGASGEAHREGEGARAGLGSPGTRRHGWCSWTAGHGPDTRQPAPVSNVQCQVQR